MKKNLVLAITLLSLSAQADFIKRNVYEASCQLGVPLSTYTPCNENYGVGRKVTECAMDRALDLCEGDRNIDCVEVSVNVTERASAEFPGYKICEGEARVHGYGF